MKIEDLSDYSAVRQLNKGGMTELYVALTRDHERVIVRFLKEIYDKDKAVRKQFSNGVEVLKKLDHPNIVKMLSHGTYKHSPYMVVEYYNAKNLRELINLKSPLLFDHKVVIMKQLANAVRHIHAKGYLHMDLKPENFLVQDDLHCILLDFDLTIKHNHHKPVKLKDLSGTPAYFSPETLRDGIVDERSEIYTYGAMIYEMLTLRKPYQSNSIAEFREKVMDPLRRPVAMDTYRDDIHKSVETVILKCLAKNPEDRYASMDLVYRDIMSMA